MEKLGPDRLVAFRFVGGESLIVELATHGANLVHLDPEGKVVGAVRQPRAARRRIAPGEPYRAPEMPRSRLVPFGAGPDRIDGLLEKAQREGEERFEALRHRVFGVGTVGAARVVNDGQLSARFYSETAAEPMTGWADMPGDLTSRPDGRSPVEVMVEEFVASILNDTSPPLDVHRSMDFVLPGVLAHESALRGGVKLDVPDLRPE